MDVPSCELLLHGIDTLQAAYYLTQQRPGEWGFAKLLQTRESLRQLGDRDGAPLTLGGMPFVLSSHGTSSGYPFLLAGEDFKIECGEFNTPSFFVTFRSHALWRESAPFLHEKFLRWAASVGFVPHKPERVSRVDFAFDYALPVVDFDEDCFVTRMHKDSQHRENGRVQTFTFGQGDIVLRVYDKVAEIEQQSAKVWFFLLWERDQDVWRIEWQVRKKLLRAFGISTMEEMGKLQGDLLRYLCEEQATLRVRGTDTNRSRWELHPLWEDLQGQVAALAHLGVCRLDGKAAALEERLFRCAQSVYGYAKGFAATHCVQRRKDTLPFEEALRLLLQRIEGLHDPLSWGIEVEKKRLAIESGEW
jgi:hypothetical protein